MHAQPETHITELPDNILQVGRQPIFDRNLNTYGYELLYRDKGIGPVNIDGDKATARTMLYTLLEFGLNNLVGPHRAFINLTKTFFTNMEAPQVDKSRVVLEVLEDIQIDDQMISCIRTLHDSGYMIALDDYRFEPHWEPLFPYASVIKVEITDLDLDAHAGKIASLKARGITLLAEKVETHAEFEQTLALGFDLFQGYFFSKPQVMSNRRLESNQLVLLQMLSRVNDPACTIEELASLISNDPKLSFKILRFINSAAVGLSTEIKSIQHAVIHIGLNRLRSWATLFILADMDISAAEVITTCLIRAELCQSITNATGSGDSSSAYTVGLLSMLDALLNLPMEEVIKELPLPDAMADALASRSGPYSQALNCAIALEQYQWQSDYVSQTLTVPELTGLYIQALSRAEEFRRAFS